MAQQQSMKVGVILGSSREGRQTDKMAKWVMKELQDRKDIQAELVDLRDYDLPLFNEPVSPKYNQDRKPTGVVKQWLDKLASFEAYIIVTPEYNHSLPAVLKNALDYTDYQVMRKPFAIVSHGTAGGARAAAHLKAVISEIRGVVISTSVAFTHRVGENFDDNGNISEAFANAPMGPVTNLHNLIEELHWYSDALTAARKTAQA